MNIQRPTYLDLNPINGQPMGGMGDASAATGGVKCSPWTAGIIGAVLMYTVPPFLSGLISGGKEAWDERDR